MVPDHMHSESRRAFLRHAAAGAGLAALASTPAAHALHRRPNVLFVMTDQQTSQALSAAGNPYLHTPHKDSLAANGVLFRKSYCTSPVCSPARSSLVTSRMPHETGVPHNIHQNFDTTLPNMGSVFREAGYDTAWAGKWHLPQSYPKGDEIPGFEYLQPMPRPERNFNGSNVDPCVADAAISYLDRKHNKPFLLGVSLHKPARHLRACPRRATPSRTTTSRSRRYPPTSHRIPTSRPLSRGSVAVRSTARRTRARRAGPTTSGAITCTATTAMSSKWTRRWDASLQALRATGIEEDTVVLFTSDHGEGTAAHKWVVKLMLYDEPTTVPLIVQWKGVTPQRVDTTHLVSGLDVLPTLCDYAGIVPFPPPEWRGGSLRGLIESPQRRGRDFLVTQLYLYPEEQGRMLRTQQHKYVVFSMGRAPGDALRHGGRSRRDEESGGRSRHARGARQAPRPVARLAAGDGGQFPGGLPAKIRVTVGALP